MAKLYSDLSESDIVIRGDAEDSSDIFDHTEIGSITANGRDIDVVSFSRSREVEIDWKKIVDHSDPPTAEYPYILGYGLSYLKAEIEKRAKVGPKIETADLPRLNGLIGNQDNGVVRFYVPGYKRSLWIWSLKDLTIGKFETVDDYDEFWEKAQHAFFSGTVTPSKLRIIELAPAIIHRQYRELVELEKLGSALSNSADTLVASQIDSFLSQGQIDDLVASYTRMRSVGLNIKERLERLRDRASDLGYILAIADGIHYTYPDGSTEALEKGQLYQPYDTEVTWTTRYQRTDYVTIFGSLRVPRTVNVTEHHRKSVTKYNKIIPDFDPWVEEENNLSNAGYSTFRFSRVGSRYVSETGEELEDIIDRCELDPEFGRRCAVFLPVYEQSLVAGEVLSKYLVVRAPSRGLEPIRTPQIFVEEDLVFSTNYVGAEVGELASSINLAPGEKREIVVESSTKTEIEVRRTATSLSDLNEASSIDYASELEKEARASRERTTTQSLSASAGGSYGGFSASASGSSSSSQTTKDFARNLSKVARKAARSVTRQTRLEVQSSSLRKTTTSSRESTKIEIENINEGRSLNLLLYHLYNVYQARLKLERLSFTFLSGIEIVSGSGIVLPQQFSLDELPEMFDQFNLTQLPIKPNPQFMGDHRDKALETVLDALVETLKEYNADGGEGSETVVLPEFPPAGANFDEKIKALTKSLTSIVYSGAEIPLYESGKDTENFSEFLIGSPGLYLDAHVGERPSTEPFSENMRRTELGMRRAEIEEVNAKAEYHKALASRLGRVPADIVVSAMAIDLKNLELAFSSAPQAGDWDLFVGEAYVLTTTIPVDQEKIVITFAQDQDWLKASTAYVCRLVHKTLETELYFLV